jgi:chromate reductase
MHIVAISGSLRADSLNTRLLRNAQHFAPEGMTVELLDIAEIPLFNGDVETAGLPDAVRFVKDRIHATHGLLLASPEYNHTYSGVIKNTLDWLSRGPDRPFPGKPVAVLAASPGNFGGIRAQTELRRLMLALGAHVLPQPELIVPQAPSKFDEQGVLIDERMQTTYRTLLTNLRDLIARLQQA